VDPELNCVFDFVASRASVPQICSRNRTQVNQQIPQKHLGDHRSDRHGQALARVRGAVCMKSTGDSVRVLSNGPRMGLLG